MDSKTYIQYLDKESSVTVSNAAEDLCKSTEKLRTDVDRNEINIKHLYKLQNSNENEMDAMDIKIHMLIKDVETLKHELIINYALIACLAIAAIIAFFR